MSAIIQPLGSLKPYTGGQPVPVEPGGRVSEVLERLGIPPEIVALVLVGDAPVAKDYVLRDGDVIKLLAVIGGG